MKINRLIEIVTILLNRQTITAKELADRFEVSRRTIYRDIDVLSEAGIPIYTDKGKGGGISILEDYTLNKTLLSKSESEGLVLALKAMGATDYPEADVILEKIGSIFKNNIANEWIEINFDSWSSRVNEDNKFSKLRDSIISNQIVNFNYINVNGIRSNRDVEPVKLVFSSFSWYLVAFCHMRQEYRVFRLSRIKNVKVLEKHFTKRVLTELDLDFDFSPLIKLVIRCDETVLNRLYDTFDEQFFTKNEDNSYTLTIEVPEDEWVYGYILSFGNNAEVVEPICIREEIRRRAKEVANKYL